MPVAVSMGSTAASGGLMVAMAGHRIFANPSTVTGSIGVRMDIPQIQDLMSKLGIGRETLVTAPFKGCRFLQETADAAGSGLSARRYHGYAQAICGNSGKGAQNDIRKPRNWPTAKIFTGQQAMDLGLIDAMGGFDDALLWLAKQTGIPANRKLCHETAGQGWNCPKICWISFWAMTRNQPDCLN